jgi:hypothetical protein
MKTKISIVVVIALLVALSLCTLLRPRFPNRCPYGHTELVEKTQKVSSFGTGTPSIWSKIHRKYIDPPRKYMYCTKCGWAICSDGRCSRYSEDPSSFIPPFPVFSTLSYPEMSFTYGRTVLHNEIVYDYVIVRGSFSIEVEYYILSHLGKHGFKQFKSTLYMNTPVLQATHGGYTVRITYTQTKKHRKFHYIYIIYPGMNQDDFDGS